MTKKVWIWLGLTFVSSWLYFLTYDMFGEGWRDLSLAMATFMPAFMVLIVKKVIYNEPLKGAYLLQFRFNRFIFLGILSPVLLILYIVILNILFTPASLGVVEPIYGMMLDLGVLPDQMILAVVLFTLVNGIAGGVTINAVLAFGGEYGWRGFLQDEWSYMGPWRSSALIGVVWGLWSAPLVLQGVHFPEHPVIGIFLLITSSSFLAVIISYFTRKSGTIITAALFIGVFNAVSLLTVYMTEGYIDIWHGPFGVTALFVYASVSGLLYWYDHLRQRRGKIKAEVE